MTQHQQTSLSTQQTGGAPPLGHGPQKQRWRDIWRIYAQAHCLRMLFLGFSAGLPLLLVMGTLSFRLREAGIDRTTIGFLSWVGLIYGLKFLWAPLVDNLPLPLLDKLLGRRRSWLLLAQAAVIGALAGMALTDPQQSLIPLVACALLTALAAATQDIALDAYRIESAQIDQQAALAAMYQTGYRLAMIWAGAGALWLVARAAESATPGYLASAWRFSYLVMAASMLVGVITVLLSPEPATRRPSRARHATLGQWMHDVLFSPFVDFIARYRWHAALLLALMAVYRISDIVMGVMANPFYVDMGYTKEQIAAVSKIYGIVMTLLGAFIGGALSLRLGVMRVLMLGAFLSASSNLLFAWLATSNASVAGLVFVISADNLSAGVASSAFVAYLSGLASARYSATQYALFTSIMVLLPKWLAGFSGVLVDRFEYPAFFIGTALLGLPVMLLIWLASRVQATATARQ